MTDIKKLILDANDHIKSAASSFEKIFEAMQLDEAVSQNSSMAFSEIIKCIKHISLIQGDITGKELMGSDFVSSVKEFSPIPTDDVVETLNS